jgi:predicted nucleic acid-binding protein
MNLAVIDAATALAWFVPSPASPAASRLLTASDAGQLLLTAPASLLGAVGEALVQLRRRVAIFGARHCALVIEALQAMPIVYEPDAPLINTAVLLSARSGISVHQAASVALALAYGVPLYSADKTLLARALPGELQRVIASVESFS